MARMGNILGKIHFHGRTCLTRELGTVLGLFLDSLRLFPRILPPLLSSTSSVCARVLGMATTNRRCKTLDDTMVEMAWILSFDGLPRM